GGAPGRLGHPSAVSRDLGARTGKRPRRRPSACDYGGCAVGDSGGGGTVACADGLNHAVRVRGDSVSDAWRMRRRPSRTTGRGIPPMPDRPHAMFVPRRMLLRDADAFGCWRVAQRTGLVPGNVIRESCSHSWSTSYISRMICLIVSM